MSDVPPDEESTEEDPSLGFDTIADAAKRLDLSVDVDALMERGFTEAEVLYLLDHCPFVQLTDGDLKAPPTETVQFVTADSGWVIHDYGDAMSSSPGQLLFGGVSRTGDDDDEGGGASPGKGTLVRQRYITARDMVALAIEHGWGSVNLVDGHPKMMRDVWIESQKQGITVIGFRPTEQDKATRDRIVMSSDAMAARRATRSKGN